jgi:hypothetical protein
MSPFRRLDTIKNSAERVKRIHPHRSYLLSFCGLFLDTYTSLRTKTVTAHPNIPPLCLGEHLDSVGSTFANLQKPRLLQTALECCTLHFIAR